MTDRSLVLVAGVTAAAALWGYPVPAAVVGVCVVAASAAVRFQPSRASGAPWTVVFLVALALASATSHRAFVATSALDDALPRTVRGVATLRTDPEPTLGGARAIIEIQHRRYLATFTQPVASIVGDLLAGERVQLVAQPRRLRHVSVDWQRSQHLAGRVATGTAVIGPAPSLLARCANGVRRRLVAGADPLPEDLRPLYLGLVVGDDRSQAPVLRHQFRASGLAHLLAVSGQNVAFVLLAAAPLLGRLRLVPRAIATMLLLALFTMVVRAEASVLRAVAMAFVVVVAALLGRRVSPLRGALLAAVALLVADPLLIRSVGFRLSVAATVGLVVLTRPIARHVPGPRPFATAVSVVLAAQVATSPVLVPLADGVPAAGVLANLLAVPAAGVVMVLGLTAGPLAGLLDPRLAVPLMWPARVLVRWVWLVAGAAARAPLPLLGPARLAVVAVAVVLAAVARSRWADSAALRRAAFGSLGLLVLAAVTVSGARAPGVHDLGSGVRMIVGDCGGRAVDVSGASTAPDRVLDRLHQQGVHRIDVLVVAGNRRGVALARDIASTASVQRIVAPIDVAVGPVVPLTNGPLDVGGLTLTAVGAGRPSGRVQVQRVPCTVAP